MPEIVLHIQTEDSPATRVLALAGATVRIGRSAQCELCLGEPALAEVQCMLRRRGESWHLQPVGPSGQVSIDGKPVDLTRPLPLGVTVRVGDHWLTLRTDDEGPSDVKTCQAPAAVEPAAIETEIVALATKVAIFAAASDAEPEPQLVPEPAAADAAEAPAHAGTDAERDRLAQWQARLEQRERWLQARAEERKWVARWKAAGTNMSAKAGPITTPTTMPTTPRPTAPPRPPEPPLPRYAEVARFRAAWNAQATPRRAEPPDTPRPASAEPTAGENPVEELRADPVETAPRPEVQPAPAPEPQNVQENAPVESPRVEPAAREPRPAAAAVEVRPRPKPAPRVRTPLADRHVYDPVGMAPSPGVGFGLLQGAARKAAAALRRGLRSERDPQRPEDPRPSPRLGRSVPKSVDRRTDRGREPTARISVDDGEREGKPACSSPIPQPPPMLGRSSAEPDTSQPPEAPQTGSDASESAPGALGVSRQLPGVTWREVQVGDPATRDLPAVPPAEPHPIAPSGTGGPTLLRPTSGRFGPPPPPSSSAAHSHVPAPETRSRAHEAPLARVAPPLEGPEWPSARSIFAARGPRPGAAAAPGQTPQATPKVKVRRVVVRPLPTVGCMPESWNVPLWPVWVCAMLVVLLVGLVGLSLSWSWARDDASAGLVANRVLGKEPRPERKKAEPLDPSLAPDASWWRSTPGHQFLWALALEKAAAGADPDRAEAVRFYLHAARSSAPAQAAARFALAHPAPNEPKVPELSECLGLTRDVIALAWMGQRLLEVGKTEAALRAFGEALDMACRADLRDLDSPAFLEDAQVHRYALPHEVLIGPIVLALAEKRELAFSEWAPVLPACAVAPLAASRALHELGRTNEAEQALDLVLTGTDEPQLAGASPAVHTAAQAEALALRGRWVEAEALYREAIDDMPNDTFRRSWWMNLADIYLRLNDDARKRSAWEAAKGTDPKEEITRRVIQSQTQAGLGVGSSRKRTPGPASDRSLEPRGDRPEGTTTRPQASKADR